jgi:hypothetical protein
VNRYAPKHNPMIYFTDVNGGVKWDSSECIDHIRPYSELARDLEVDAVPAYSFITPNLCNDMHGGAGCPSANRILVGDTWLANEIPRIMNSRAYSNNGAIIITWDEGTANVAGPFGTIVLSSFAKGGGYHMTNRLDHTATFRTLQEIFHVPLLYAAKTGPNLGDLFKPAIQLTTLSFSTNQSPQFMANGIVPGKTNYVQFTTNLADTNPAAWRNLLTNVLPTNRFLFMDTNASNSARRFYRVLETY